MNVEAIKEEIDRLPEQERKQLLDWLELGGKGNSSAHGPSTDVQPLQGNQTRRRTTISPEQDWIAGHRDKYRGEWVALDGATLIAHDRDGKAAYDRARAAGVKAPFIAFVDPEPSIPFAGW